MPRAYALKESQNEVFKSILGVHPCRSHFCDRRFNLEHRSARSGRRLADRASRIRPQESGHRRYRYSQGPRRAWRSERQSCREQPNYGRGSGPWEGQGAPRYRKKSAERGTRIHLQRGRLCGSPHVNVRRDDWDDHPRGDRDQDDRTGLRIIRGYYGVQGRTAIVTDLLRSRVRDGALGFVVTNGAIGVDPAPGADKVLIVIYRYQGYETAAAVREGFTLTIP